ncbi:hypothetical protein F511_45446 [Dorcoceras hygrometricum]|uniref:Uncharacterized protein n=1 Tax=Dorcoceras hygrometricum TaxID=472368 RepID=A0A2Z6ZX53_9LAMI|nr:hypothetical protein F511_45446 [Dorcoceras hygrometricum]
MGWPCASGCASGRSTLADGCAFLSRRLAHTLRKSATSLAAGVAPRRATTAETLRALAVRPPHEKRSNEALLVERDAPHDGTRLRRALSRSCVIFRCWPPPPPLRRVSGDVVTAGLISSRVWFGPVPGSP